MYKVQSIACGFGDRLLAAWVVNILNFNNIPTIFVAPSKILSLVNCHVWEPKDPDDAAILINIKRSKNPKFTILTDLLDSFIRKSGENITLSQIDIENAPHPMSYTDNPDIDGLTVCLVTQTGKYTPYRNWPYFQELKTLFTTNGISFIDLSAELIWGNDFLNYVKKSKIYLGLETGASHYAAPYVDDAGIIVQSGYSDFNYWAAHYNYEHLHYDINCAPCWKRVGCPYDHECMREIPAMLVYDKITKRMNDLS